MSIVFLHTFPPPYRLPGGLFAATVRVGDMGAGVKSCGGGRLGGVRASRQVSADEPSAAFPPPAAGQHRRVGAPVRAHRGGVRSPLRQAAGPQRLPVAGCQVPEPLLHAAADPGGGTQARGPSPSSLRACSGQEQGGQGRPTCRAGWGPLPTQRSLLPSLTGWTCLQHSASAVFPSLPYLMLVCLFI